MEEAKRILVVDDEGKIAEVIKSYLENSGYFVITALAGKEALETFEREKIDLIILDLMLPDISGEEICKTIRKKSRVPIIMLTAKIEEESILNGLNMGSDDYVIKPFSPRQIVARVKALLRRAEGEILSEITSFNNEGLIIDFTRHEVKKDGILISLTPNEYKILYVLSKRPQKVFTREELIEAAFGKDFEGFDRTIDSHIKNLRQKIETDSKHPEYIITIHGFGYKFGKEDMEG